MLPCPAQAPGSSSVWSYPLLCTTLGCQLMLVCFVLLRSFCKRFPASMGGFGKGLQAVNSQFTPTKS